MVLLRLCEKDDTVHLIPMIMEFYRYHRCLTGSRRPAQVDADAAQEVAEEWLSQGQLYVVEHAGATVGFLHLRFGGDRAAWIENMYMAEEYRRQGMGRDVIRQLDQYLTAQQVRALFVQVIPRNLAALSFFLQCGFDHLNSIELRKNYDSSLDKEEEVELLGFRMRKF